MDGGDSNDSALSLLDEKREKHLIRKIDLHIIPFVVLLYLFSFLDRGMSSCTCYFASLLPVYDYSNDWHTC